MFEEYGSRSDTLCTVWPPRKTKGPTVFNLPVGWFKQTPHRSVDFRLSHRSSHQSPTAANTPPIRYYHSVMSIIALIHHHRSLPPSLPPIIVSDVPEVVEGEIRQPRPPLTRPSARSLWRSDTTERAWAPRQSASRSPYSVCLMSVICLIYRCRAVVVRGNSHQGL